MTRTAYDREHDRELHEHEWRPGDRVTPGVDRETVLMNFYAAERRAGADPLTANERMAAFAKRLDAYEQEKSNERSR